MDEDEVDRPVADDLVCDPDIAASRVGDIADGSLARGSAWRRAARALRVRRRLEGRVLLQHLPLELAKRSGGLDPHLVGKRPPKRLVARERLRVPAGPVEREHVLQAEALAKRVLGDQRFELADHVAVMAEREVGLDPLLERGQAELLETRALVPGERLRDLGQRGPAPERKRVTPAAPSPSGHRLPRAPGERRRPQRSKRVRSSSSFPTWSR